MFTEILASIALFLPTYCLIRIYKAHEVAAPETFVNYEKLLVGNYYLFELHMVSTTTGEADGNTSLGQDVIMHKFGNKWRYARVFKKERSLLQGERNHAIFIIIPLIETLSAQFSALQNSQLFASWAQPNGHSM